MRNNLLVRREKIVQRINDDGLLQDNNENTLRTACVLIIHQGVIKVGGGKNRRTRNRTKMTYVGGDIHESHA